MVRDNQSNSITFKAAATTCLTTDIGSEISFKYNDSTLSKQKQPVIATKFEKLKKFCRIRICIYNCSKISSNLSQLTILKSLANVFDVRVPIHITALNDRIPQEYPN